MSHVQSIDLRGHVLEYASYPAIWNMKDLMLIKMHPGQVAHVLFVYRAWGVIVGPPPTTTSDDWTLLMVPSPDVGYIAFNR